MQNIEHDVSYAMENDEEGKLYITFQLLMSKIENCEWDPDRNSLKIRFINLTHGECTAPVCSSLHHDFLNLTN